MAVERVHTRHRERPEQTRRSTDRFTDKGVLTLREEDNKPRPEGKTEITLPRASRDFKFVSFSMLSGVQTWPAKKMSVLSTSFADSDRDICVWHVYK